MNNTSSLHELFPEVQQGIIWGISATLTIVIIVINLVTIYVLRTVDTLREKYGILLVGYCLVDILNGLQVTYLQVKYWLQITSYSFCEWRDIVVSSTDALPYTLSSWHTVLLTFDRYIAVCHPFRYHKIMSQKIQKVLIGVAWLISIFENFLPHLYFKAFECGDVIGVWPKNMDTRMQLGHITFISMLHFIMYSRIWWIAHKMRQRSVEAFSENPRVRWIIVDKATITVFCVVVSSYVIWMPYMISQLIPGNFDTDDFFVKLTILLGYCGSFINNIIYVLINKSFRDGFMRLACK